MKRLTLVAVAVGLCVSVLSAGSASAAGPSNAQLAKKLTALQKTVATQAKTITTLRNEIAANFVGDACIEASTGDMFQWTWIYTNKGSSFPYFSSTTTAPPIPDNDACKAIGVTRSTPTDQTPPSLGVFSAIIKWLIG